MSHELTDTEWRAFQAIPEQGYSHRAWVNWRIQERVAAAIEGAAKEVEACVCPAQMDASHDPRVQECPHHGDNAAVFFAQMHATIIRRTAKPE